MFEHKAEGAEGREGGSGDGGGGEGGGRTVLDRGAVYVLERSDDCFVWVGKMATDAHRCLARVLVRWGGLGRWRFRVRV